MFIDSADVAVDKTHTGNAVPGQAARLVGRGHQPRSRHRDRTVPGRRRPPGGHLLGHRRRPRLDLQRLPHPDRVQPDERRRHPGGRTRASPRSRSPPGSRPTPTRGPPSSTTPPSAPTPTTPTSTNNTDTDTATARRSVDLAIGKQVSGPFVAGRDATYLLTVTNNGPSDSTGPIVVTDPVPAGTTFVSANGPTWSCDLAAGQVTCTRAAGLAAGAVAPRRSPWSCTSAADRTTAVTNTAPSPGPSPDPVPANNTATVTRTPDQQADLAIAEDLDQHLHPGPDRDLPVRRPQLRSVVRRAADPDHRHPARRPHVHGVHLGDPGLDLLGRRPGRDLYAVQRARAAAATATVLISVDDRPLSARQHPQRRPRVGSPTPDPNPANNTDGDDTDSTAEADLAITKTHTPEPGRRGSERHLHRPRPEQRTVRLLRADHASSTPCRSA